MADLDDETELRGSIYAIIDASTGEVIYVGKTTYQRDGDRFIEHVNNDLKRPWHKAKHADAAYQDADDTKWPYYPRKLCDLKDFTALEIAASEQFYWEHFGGLEGKLKNDVQPLRLQTFNKHKTAKTFRPLAKKFPAGWAPKL